MKYDETYRDVKYDEKLTWYRRQYVEYGKRISMYGQRNQADKVLVQSDRIHPLAFARTQKCNENTKM